MSKTLKRIIALLTCVAIVFSLSLSVLADTKTVSTTGGIEEATFVCTASYHITSGIKGVKAIIAPQISGHYIMDKLQIKTYTYLNGEDDPRYDSGTTTTNNTLTKIANCFPESMVDSGYAICYGWSEHYGNFIKTVNC